MIDLHSHILPGIDDGSESIAQSVEMLRMEAQQGITGVVATPHFYPHHDTPGAFLSRRDRAEKALRQEISGHCDLPRVEIGAEVYFFRGICDSDALPELTICGKNSILIEMPPAPWQDSAIEELAEIWYKRGIRPIIAHIDRYIAPFRTYGIPERLEELPVLVQANAEFFLNPHTSRMAMKMLKADRIHLLGSDCHNTTTRSPNLGAALQRIARKLGPDVLERIRSYESEFFEF